jgi:D-arginine dehydrogenase
MVRQVVAPALAAVVSEGARLLRAGFDGVAFRRCGSLLLAVGAEAARLRDAMPLLREHHIDSDWISARAVAAKVPLTAGGTLDGALHTADDGVVDVAALLRAFLRGAGGRAPRLLLNQEVTAVRTRRGAVSGLVTASGERIATPAVVNAAGAWATSLAHTSDTTAVPLRVARRHLMHTALMPDVGAEWPIVWDESHGFYFRPESGGLLLSPCDETDHPPGTPALSAEALDLLARKLTCFMPRLGDRVAVRRAWAGLRTMARDGRFVIGEDPRLRGFVWCAGLGGHGVAASAAVGRLAAAAVMGMSSAADHSPARFEVSGGQCVAG